MKNASGVLFMLLCMLQSAYGLANLSPAVTDPANFLPPRILVGVDVTTSIKPSRPQTLDGQAIASALPHWMSRDPLGEDETVNLYQFTGNDPINKVDVLGLEESSLIYQFFFGLDPITIKRKRTAEEEKQHDIEQSERIELMLIFDEIGRGEVDEGYYSKEIKLALISEFQRRASIRDEIIANLEKQLYRSPGEFRATGPPPYSTAALTLGAANTPINAAINSDFLLPSGSLGLAFKGTSVALRSFIRTGNASARFETSLLNNSLALGDDAIGFGLKNGSSAKSVGKFWLWQFSKCMKQSGL